MVIDHTYSTLQFLKQGKAKSQKDKVQLVKHLQKGPLKNSNSAMKNTRGKFQRTPLLATPRLMVLSSMFQLRNQWIPDKLSLILKNQWSLDKLNLMLEEVP